MHELSIVASLFEILEEKARDHQAKKIILVKLQVGKLAGVVPEFLQTAFETYKSGTLAEEATLEIKEVPLKVRCGKCRAEVEKEEYVFICPVCGSGDLQIVEGTELLLEKIDLEI